jgi:predicted neuraminidase
MKRIVFISLTLILYLIPFYRYQQAERYWNNIRPLQQPVTHSTQTEKPFYRVDFVNEERPSRICHVSSVCPAGDGRVACTWYEGSWESAPDTAIYLSVFDEAKAQWSPPVVLVDRNTCSKELKRYVRKVGNALIYRDGRGRLWLFYSSIIFGGWSGSSLNYKISADNGKTWSRSEKLVLSPFFNLAENVKNKGMNLADRSFVIPAYHEFAKKFSEMLSVETDGGKVKYDIRKMTHTGKAVQPSLIYEEGKGLIAFFRNMASGGKNHILTAESRDMGRTWSDLQATGLPNPDSGFDMIKTRDGGYLGVINNTYSGRGNLTLILSRDGGKNWELLKVIESKKGSEYSYPSINQSTSGIYHITYTYEKKRIKHIVFNEQWIREREGQTH